MSDPYLDGSQPYHRHDDGIEVAIGTGDFCSAHSRRGVVPVHVFDPDALAAHDAAVAQQQEQGTPDAPMYDPDAWEFAFIEPVEPGAPATTARVVAGWTTDGEWRRYTTPERMARLLREYLERP